MSSGEMSARAGAASESVSIDSRQTSLEPSFSTEKQQGLGGLRFSWNILDFGVSYSQAQQRADEVLVAAELRRKAEQNLALDIQTAWWRVAAAQQSAQGIEALLVQAEDIRRTGSAALDLAYVACGRADAYFEAGVKAWDIAAGVLLVREAGGKVCDFKGAPLARMDNRGPETQQVVAGNLKVAESLQKVLVNTGYAAEFDAKF